jgi:hypothetical protein
VTTSKVTIPAVVIMPQSFAIADVALVIGESNRLD